jgi:hypothetical protein
MSIGTKNRKPGPIGASDNFGSDSPFPLIVSFCFDFFASHINNLAERQALLMRQRPGRLWLQLPYLLFS